MSPHADHKLTRASRSGRLIATHFEKLPPRQSNAAYYKKIRLPISLETIEEKLNNHEFSNMTELESYFKRMVTNAKEFHPRSSSVFDDAERVRKLVGNYMAKTNPAHGTRGFQALPTPLPPDDDDAAEEEDEEEDEEPEDEDEDAEDAEGDDAEAEEAEEPGSRRRSIVLKRTGPTRATRHSSSYAQESPKPSSNSSRKPDHQYVDVPYKGLTFQQAQEKIVEELLRHTDPEYVANARPN